MVTTWLITARSTQQLATCNRSRDWLLAAGQLGMGILLDVVPNHMGINDPGNIWWTDVLENGEGSYVRRFFRHRVASAPRRAASTKFYCRFWASRSAGCWKMANLRVVYRERRLQLEYGPRRFPLSPPSWPFVLELRPQRRAVGCHRHQPLLRVTIAANQQHYHAAPKLPPRLAPRRPKRWTNGIASRKSRADDSSKLLAASPEVRELSIVRLPDERRSREIQKASISSKSFSTSSGIVWHIGEWLPTKSTIAAFST